MSARTVTGEPADSRAVDVGGPTSVMARAAALTGGGPFVVPAAPSAAYLDDVLRHYTAWITLPGAAADSPAALTTQLRESRTLTGWALRDLADVLGTTHTTVRRLEALGTASARSRDTAARAAQLHAVLVRLSRLAPGPVALRTALTAHARTGPSALDHLRAADWSRALTAALDALRGPRPALLGAAQGGTPAPATRELRP